MFQELLGHLTNFGALRDSALAWVNGLSVSGVIMMILMLFMVVGIVDKVRGNKYGYGEKFDEGFNAMGSLALAVVGIVALSPVLLQILSPIVTPLFGLVGANPAMFPASILALDMGGYVLSMQLAGAEVAVGNYAGIIVASTMGITVCFTIPFALTLMKKEDRPILSMGMLVGIVTLPLGCLVGGLLMGSTSTPLGFGELIKNTLPVILLAVIVALGLLLKPEGTMRAFQGFGKGMTLIITISPAIAIFQYITGLRLPLFNLMVEPDPVLGGVPLEIGLLLVGQIAIVLTGAFPMILFINRRLGRAMDAFGRSVGIGKEASTGLLTQLASAIPVWGIIDEMDPRGKLFNVAFAVSGSFVFGDVLAFAGGANPEMVFPVIAAKLTGGVLAILLLILLKNTPMMRKVLSPEHELG